MWKLKLIYVENRKDHKSAQIVKKIGTCELAWCKCLEDSGQEKFRNVGKCVRPPEGESGLEVDVMGGHSCSHLSKDDRFTCQLRTLGPASPFTGPQTSRAPSASVLLQRSELSANIWINYGSECGAASTDPVRWLSMTLFQLRAVNCWKPQTKYSYLMNRYVCLSPIPTCLKMNELVLFMCLNWRESWLTFSLCLWCFQPSEKWSPDLCKQRSGCWSDIHISLKDVLTINGAGLPLFTSTATDASFRIHIAETRDRPVWRDDTQKPEDRQKLMVFMGNHFRRSTLPPKELISLCILSQCRCVF